MTPLKHPCDCCGHRTLTEPSGRTGQICPVCFWEDSAWLDAYGEGFGDIDADLETAQQNFAIAGVCHPDFADGIRAPSADEPRSPAWRSIADEREASANELRLLIHSAFRGVSRHGGVSLRETDALDEYLGEQGRAAARAQDKDRNWTDLKSKDLVWFDAAHSFFDPIGYRYHLPAYLMCWLDGHAESSGSTVFDSFLWGWARMHLTQDITVWTSGLRDRLELLTPAQCYVVGRFIFHLACFDPDTMFTRPDARKALANYWQTVLDAGPPATPA